MTNIQNFTDSPKLLRVYSVHNGDVRPVLLHIGKNITTLQRWKVEQKFGRPTQILQWRIVSPGNHLGTENQDSTGECEFANECNLLQRMDKSFCTRSTGVGLKARLDSFVRLITHYEGEPPHQSMTHNSATPPGVSAKGYPMSCI